MDFLEKKYEYVVSNVVLVKDTVLANETVDIPEGKVVAMAAIMKGNDENRLIDLGVFQNNNEVVKTCAVEFSEKTSGGTYKDSMRPVDLSGGKQYQVRLTASVSSAVDNVTVQAIFMIEKPEL